jgi:hypothetical protein
VDASVAAWAPGTATVTSTAPGAWAGQVAVIAVVLATDTTVPATPPNETVAPAWKPVPVSVRALPPPTGQEVGEIPVRDGGGVPPTPLPPSWPPPPPPQATIASASASASEVSTGCESSAVLSMSASFGYARQGSGNRRGYPSPPYSCSSTS